MGWLIGAAIVSLGILITDTIIDNKKDKEDRINSLKTQYNTASSELLSMQTEYDLIDLEDIPEAQAELDNTNNYLANWDEIYNSKVGEAEVEISTYDDYLNSWQDIYEEQTLSAESQGRDNLSSLLANWSDAEVIAADRGATGSMSLIANQEKNKAVEYAGEDLSIAGNDGLFGMSYDNLKVGLLNNKTQAENTLSVLNTNLDLLKFDLEDDQAQALTTQTNLQNAIAYHEQRKLRLQQQIADKEDLMDDLKNEGGF